MVLLQNPRGGLFPTSEVALYQTVAPEGASAIAECLDMLTFAYSSHPGGNSGSNLKANTHRCYLREEEFEGELTDETICLPLE